MSHPPEPPNDADSHSLPIEALLRHSGWLRALARALSNDSGSADDLLQDTWVAAIESPPDQPGALAGWLRRVLQNNARLEHRSTTRRRQRERQAARRERSDESLLERLEWQEHLSRELRILPEVYRRPLILKYYEGWSTEKIAEELALTPSAVRSRLQRGLAKLRCRFDELYGERRQWCVNALIVAGAYETGGRVVGGSLSAVQGGLLMAKKIALLLVVVLLLIGGSLYLGGGNSDHAADGDSSVGRASSELQVTEGATAIPAASQLASSPPHHASTADSAEVPPTTSPEGTSSLEAVGPIAVVRGRIWRTDGGSLEGGTLSLWGGGRPQSRIERDGTFRIESPFEAGTSIFLDFEGFSGAVTTVTPVFDQEVVIDIPVDWGNELTLRVLSQEEESPLSCELWLHKDTHRGQAAAVRGATGADGIYHVPFLPDGTYQISLTHPEFTPHQQLVQLPHDDEVVIHLVPARLLRVQVVGWERYAPLGRMQLHSFCLERPAGSPHATGENYTVSGVLDADGVMVVNAPSPGTWSCELNDYDRIPAQSARLSIDEGNGPLELVFELPVKGDTTLMGHVFDTRGGAIIDGKLLLRTVAKGARREEVAQIREDGSYRLEGVVAGSYHVLYQVGSGNDRVDYPLGSMDIPATSEVERNVTLPGLSSLQVVVTEIPDELLAVSVTATLTLLGEAQSRSIFSVNEASYPMLLEYLEAGRYRLEIEINGDPAGQAFVDLGTAEDRHFEMAYEAPTRCEFVLSGKKEDDEWPSHLVMRTDDSLTARSFAAIGQIHDGRGVLVVLPGTHDVQFELKGYEIAPRAMICPPGNTVRVSLTAARRGDTKPR